MALPTAFLRDVWAIHPPALEGFATAATRYYGDSGLLARKAELSRAQVRLPLQTAGGVATVGVRGVILRGESDDFLNAIGLSNTGMATLIAAIEKAREDPGVSALVLDVDSPGGVAHGIDAVISAVEQAREGGLRTAASISGMGASAAFMIAASAGRVVAEPDAIVGSIGVFSVIPDLSRAAEDAGIRVHVIRSGEFKGMGTPGAPVTEAQLDMQRAMIDGLAEHFVASIARGRRMGLGEVQALATGAIWTGTQAEPLGLIDAVGGIDTALPKEGRDTMANTTTNAAPPVQAGASTEAPPTIYWAALQQQPLAAQPAPPQPVAPEKIAATASELQDKFGDEPGFCLGQLASGATLEAAEAAYGKLKLEKRDRENAELKAQLEAAKAKPAGKPSGVSPLANEGSPPDEEDAEDFRSKAKALAEERFGGSFRKAASYLARTQPDMHAAWVAEQKTRFRRKVKS